MGEGLVYGIGYIVVKWGGVGLRNRVVVKWGGVGLWNRVYSCKMGRGWFME